MGELGEWCTVTVTVMISTTAPINKKQKKVGNEVSSKDTWGIQSMTPCGVLLGLFSLRYLGLSREGTGE